MLPPYGPSGGGDITGVTAGTGLSGGGSSGTVTVSLDSPVTVAHGGTGGTDAATARTNLSALSSAAGAVGASNLATNAVTAAKLAAAQKRRFFVQGRNGAGAVTLTGALVGDKLDGAINLASGPGANLDRTTAFESTITVANQIQQTSASDLSAEAIQFDLIRSGS